MSGRKINRPGYSIFRKAMLLALLASCWGLRVPAQSAAGHKKSKEPKKSGAPAEERKTEPFHVGEKFEYRISWANFATAATVDVEVPERRNLYGWDTWHLRALAHTVNPVRTLFAIDDQFDSYSDTRTLESHQYEMYLRELGRTQDSVMRLAAQNSPLHVSGPTVLVQPGTRDPVGAFFALREVDWRHSKEIHGPVYDGRSVYEMRAHLENAAEQVVVPAGTFQTARVAIRMYGRNGEVPQADFVVWLADNPAHLPVLVQAELPFGKLRAELTSAAK